MDSRVADNARETAEEEARHDVASPSYSAAIQMTPHGTVKEKKLGSLDPHLPPLVESEVKRLLSIPPIRYISMLIFILLGSPRTSWLIVRLVKMDEKLLLWYMPAQCITFDYVNYIDPWLWLYHL
jgi:hypothetical protein